MDANKLSHEALIAYCAELIEAYDKLVHKLHEQVDTNPSGSISSEKIDRSRNLPLNGDQILEGFNALGFTHYDYRLRCFTEGVRFAERMRESNV